MTDERLPSTFALFILVSVASAAAVLYTPGLPAMKEFFGISSDRVQWTVNTFLFGYAVGQLIYAPFSNRFNRKKTLFIALFFACLGAEFSYLSHHYHSFGLLLIGLAVMSLGSGAGLSLAFTIVNDVYSHEEARKVIPMVTLSFSIMPGIGIFAGGLLVSAFSWPACFLFLLGYFLFVAYLVYRLPETCGETDQHALKLSNIVNRYKAVSLNRSIWMYSSMWGLCTAIVYIFATTAPLVVIEKMQVDPDTYGTFNLITSAGFILGTLMTRVLVARLSPLQMMLSGLSVALIGSIALVALSSFTHMGPWSIFLSMFFIFLGLPAVFSTASSLAARELSDKATASSFMTFLNMSVAVAGMAIVVLLPGQPEQVMPKVFLAILLGIGFLIFKQKAAIAS